MGQVKASNMIETPQKKAKQKKVEMREMPPLGVELD